MNKQKQALVLAMAAMLGTAVPLSSFGATLADYDEATQARLQDNTLEYEELPALIAVYNPNMKKANDALQDGIEELNMTIGELDTNAGELNRAAEDMKEAGNAQGYMMYKMIADGVKGSVKEMKKTVTNLTSWNGKKQIRAAEYMLTSGAQQLMIVYQTTMSQREVAAKGRELAEAAYQSALTQKSLNMVTDADVLAAKQSLEQAESGLAQVDAGLLNIRQNLCMMTGWSYDAIPDIREVPAVSQERLDAMNLESDIQKAIGNNLTLIDQRNATEEAARRMTVKEKEKRARNINESEQKLRIEMGQLYDAVQEKKAEADGAAAAYAGAITTKHGADLKYQTGSIGRLQYLQAELEFLTAKASKESADMALLQAVNNYEWGVKGLASIQ